MKVLSLFDGMSCGQIALERAGIKVDKYYASEIDKYAIRVTQANYPDTIQMGDIRKVRASMLPKIDILLAGSPCQGFSFAGKQLNFKDERSILFFEFVRLLKDLKSQNPDLIFLLENVVMGQESNDVISCILGDMYPECVTQKQLFQQGRLEPIQINSALVSAQNRQRLHWTNIQGVEQPDDKGILLEDILECGSNTVNQRGRGNSQGGDRENKSPAMTSSRWEQNVKVPVIKQDGELIYKPNKSQCLDANYFKGPDNHGQRTGVIQVNPSKDAAGVQPYMQDRAFHPAGKTHALTTSFADRTNVSDVDACHWRKLTCIECERLQTVPDNYTNHVSNSQRYKMLGNGWTVDVIVHILKAMAQQWG